MKQQPHSMAMKLENPKMELSNMTIGGSVVIPSSQKNSISTTIGRVKDNYPERNYSVKKLDKQTYIVTRQKDDL